MEAVRELVRLLPAPCRKHEQKTEDEEDGPPGSLQHEGIDGVPQAGGRTRPQRGFDACKQARRNGLPAVGERREDPFVCGDAAGCIHDGQNHADCEQEKRQDRTDKSHDRYKPSRPRWPVGLPARISHPKHLKDIDLRWALYNVTGRSPENELNKSL